MRRFAFHAALLLGGLGLLGALAAAIGLVPLAASSGHWAVTDWLLHSTMRRGVALRAARIETPDLGDTALVERGAGHYHSGCAPCHGAPGLAQSAVALEMTPHPPALAGRIDDWRPAELYWIVRHGVKFTGMPAWPARERADEPWALVAFLLALPALDPAAYRDLALGPAAGAQAGGDGPPLAGLAAPPEPVLARCARCHGRDGLGRGSGAAPVIAGLPAAYIAASLDAYAGGARPSGIMRPQAHGLDPSTVRRLAAHYAAAAPPDLPAAGASDDVAAGRHIAERGVPAAGVPSCVSCHGPVERARHPLYPGLAGQDAAYIVQQLELWAAGHRGGTSFAHVMRTVAARLTPAQMSAVARYYASLPLALGN